jgi:hypothetical protein
MSLIASADAKSKAAVIARDAIVAFAENFPKTPVTIGRSPFYRTEILAALKEFTTLYEQRPIKDNSGGMKSPHMFLTWFVLRTLKPAAIIESGVWKGQGTWFMQQACPTAKLYCIEPNGKGIEWRALCAAYFKQDFSEFDWSRVDKENTVLFFDDHQDGIKRVRQACKLGFKHLLFEDNYPIGQGDCYSLKQAFAEDGADAAYLRDVLEVYEELPPVFRTYQTRWKTAWDEIPTPEPLLTNVEQPYQRLFLDEATSYTWLCYARIKP